MILVDSRKGSAELAPYIKKIGVPCEVGTLNFGDFCIEGNGPRGKMLVGIERKTLGDMLSCIDDARYSGHQRPGMLQMYARSFLIIEGSWKPHDSNGLMMESRNGQQWFFSQQGKRRVMYSKLYRYLMSVSMSGVTVTYSNDMFHTAFNICEIFHWFQKKWEDHTSLIEKHKLVMVPEGYNIMVAGFREKPPLVQRWGAELSDIGPKLSADAATLFKTPYKLATSSEEDWLRLPRVGVVMARKIIKEIHGWMS